MLQEDAKYTPAPWGRNIAPAKKYNCIYAGRNTHVAYLATQGLEDEAVEANANLIAAAPDLYEALVDLLKLHQSEPRETTEEEIAAEYALKKARAL